jgi:crotonobetainyl-CoA:carnitine CoA-transferase CaiB-like acyl-CoA transferase
MLLPLKDIRVLELANVLAGPSVGVALAELGATVIKVENLLTKGDVTRTWKLPSEDKDTDISGYFSSVNWGKKSVSIDLK